MASNRFSYVILNGLLAGVFAAAAPPSLAQAQESKAVTRPVAHSTDR